MQEEALQRFLASVRCERLIDYLDPIGETAEEALARRVRWARMTRNDPAHADEAMFLLQHEVALRTVVANEMESDKDWTEGVPAGEEKGWSREGEFTDFDDLAPTEEAPTGIMRIEDLSLDRLPRALAGTDVDPATFEADANIGTRPDAVLDKDSEESDLLSRPISNPSLLQPRGAVRTANPARPRAASPTFAAPGTTPRVPKPSNPTLMPDPFEADDEQTDPSARMAPDLIRAIQSAVTLQDEPTARPVSSADAETVQPAERVLAPVPNRAMEARPRRTVSAPVMGPKDEAGTPWIPIAVGIALLLGLGAFGYSQVPAPVELTPPLPRATTPTQPTAPAQPTVEPAAVVPEPAPVVPEPAPVVPEPAPVVPEPAPVVPEPAPVAPAVPEPAPVVPEPAPVVPEPAPVVPEPAPVVPEPAPVVPEPAPVVPEPAPVVPEPAPAVPEPAPAVPEPAPVVPEPAPAVPAPAPAVPEPAAPTPEPSPVAPVPNAKPIEVTGFWGGKIGGRGFVLDLAQEGTTLNGTAEVLESSGSWSRYKVGGTLSGSSISLKDPGGTVIFKGTVTGDKLSGAMTRGEESLRFTGTR